VQTIAGDQGLTLIFSPAAVLPISLDVTRNGSRVSGQMKLGVLTGDVSGDIDQDGRWNATGALGGTSPWPGAAFKTALTFTPGSQGTLTINVTGTWGTGTVSGPVQLAR
jgi:hypothetical protein